MNNLETNCDVVKQSTSHLSKEKEIKLDNAIEFAKNVRLLKRVEYTNAQLEKIAKLDTSDIHEMFQKLRLEK
jgi:hypothetical protein